MREGLFLFVLTLSLTRLYAAHPRRSLTKIVREAIEQQTLGFKSPGGRGRPGVWRDIRALVFSTDPDRQSERDELIQALIDFNLDGLSKGNRTPWHAAQKLLIESKAVDRAFAERALQSLETYYRTYPFATHHQIKAGLPLLVQNGPLEAATIDRLLALMGPSFPVHQRLGALEVFHDRFKQADPTEKAAWATPSHLEHLEKFGLLATAEKRRLKPGPDGTPGLVQLEMRRLLGPFRRFHAAHPDRASLIAEAKAILSELPTESLERCAQALEEILQRSREGTR